MSFICQHCKKQQPHGAKMHTVPYITEGIYHPARYKGNTLIDKGGPGTRIVKEKKMCEKCVTRQEDR